MTSDTIRKPPPPPQDSFTAERLRQSYSRNSPTSPARNTYDSSQRMMTLDDLKRNFSSYDDDDALPASPSKQWNRPESAPSGFQQRQAANDGFAPRTSASPSTPLQYHDAFRMTYQENKARLEQELVTLTGAKEVLMSEYQKMPSQGGNAIARRRGEEVEVLLDKVEKDIGVVKQQMKKMGLM